MKNLLLLISLLIGNAYAQEFKEFQYKQHIQGTDTLNYRILYPENMKEGKQYPLVMFLHGAGERGAYNQRQLTHGAKLFLDQKTRRKYPAIVVFPQCPNGIMWTHRQKEKSPQGDWIFEFPFTDEPTKPTEIVNALVDSLINSGSVDKRRTYIMGLSMGGIGTLEFLARWPQKYTAAIVICGGNDPDFVPTYCHVPIWFFHGGKDNVVPIKYSKQVYQKQTNCNPKTKYTLYPEANHNSWDATFAEPKLLKWLFHFKK